MRPLTDAEDVRLKDMYPAVWMRTARRPDLVSTEPLTLRLWVMTPESMCLVPVDVKGFAFDLDDIPETLSQGEIYGPRR